MMARIIPLRFGAAAFALLAAACGGGGENSAASMDKSGYMSAAQSMPASPPPPAMEYARDGDMSVAVVEEQISGGGQPGQGGGAPPDPAAARQIAYTFYYGFAVPTAQMESLLKTHQSLCETAGAAVCYVSNSSISGLGEEYASGSLQLRASKEWIDKFRAGLEEGLKPFGATLSSSNTSAEDLTTQIIDTTATLTSAKTLRERLQQLLADRPGKLSDLLEIERELARVQRQIDSTESILAAMKLRVSMSTLTLSYEAKYSAVSQSIWRPLGDAFSSFAPNLAGSLAGIVNFISSVLLWLVLAGGVVWFVVWRMGRKPKPAAKPPTA